MSLTYELRHKEKPSDIPGQWEDSEVLFNAHGPRQEIQRIVNAIKDVIANKEIQRIEDR